VLDIFNNDAFSITSLTDALREVKHRPSSLSDMGLFEVTSVATTSVAIERLGDTLELVAPTPRGSPGETRDTQKRTIQSIKIPHFEVMWSVYADEVQNVRAFGSQSAIQTVQGVVMDRMGQAMDDLDVTEEHARLGAVQGVVTYKGGDQLDLYSLFGVTPDAEIDFDLDNASPVDGALRAKCVHLVRSVRNSLGGLGYSHLHAVVGDDFFDDLLKHREVRDTYKGWSDEKVLRESYVDPGKSGNDQFRFGGIVWENYGARDTVGDGALLGIASAEAKFFPVGVPGLFRTYYGPADYNETVNTMGLRTYAKQWPMENDKVIRGATQRNALHLCTRPGALRSGRRT